MLAVYRRSAHQLVSNSNDDREYNFLFRRIFSYGLPVTSPRMWLPQRVTNSYSKQHTLNLIKIKVRRERTGTCLKVRIVKSHVPCFAKSSNRLELFIILISRRLAIVLTNPRFMLSTKPHLVSSCL